MTDQGGGSEPPPGPAPGGRPDPAQGDPENPYGYPTYGGQADTETTIYVRLTDFMSGADDGGWFAASQAMAPPPYVDDDPYRHLIEDDAPTMLRGPLEMQIVPFEAEETSQPIPNDALTRIANETAGRQPGTRPYRLPAHLEPDPTLGEPAATAAPTAEVQAARAARDTSIGRAGLLMASGTMVSRVLGLIRTSLLVAAMGIFAVNDAFTVANTLPNYVFILLSAGVLNAILIPQITKAMRRPDGGRAFVDALLTASLGLLAIVTVIATVLSPWILRLITDLTGPDYRLAVMFGLVCVPQIFFYGLYAVLGQVLNTRGQFAAFMWTPVAANLVQIVGLVIFLSRYGLQDQVSEWTGPKVWLLAGSMTLGIVVQGLLLVVPLMRGGFTWQPSWKIRGQGLGAASKILGWSLGALVVAQLGGIFTQFVLTRVSDQTPGVAGVAAQQNAFLIFMLPHGFITTSILTALFPQMSRAWNDADLPGLRSLTRRGLILPAVGVIPMSVAMIVLAVPAVSVLFPRLSGSAVQAVAWVVIAMAPGLLAFGITTLQQRFCFAREDGRTNLWLQLLLTVVQVGFAVGALAVAPRWAAVTVALGQTVANTVAAVAFVLVARRQLGGLRLGDVVQLYVRLSLASALAGAAAWGAVWAMARLGSGFVLDAASVVVGGLLFGALFWGAAKVFHISEVTDLVSRITRRIPGLSR